jgi:Protein of unknown function (DUF3616)
MPSIALKRIDDVKFKGEIAKDKNVSAIAIVNGFVIIGVDEGNRVLLLKRNDNHFDVFDEVVLDANAKEIDIEGIDGEDDSVYVVGSHSRKREKAEPKAPYKKNLKQFSIVKPEPAREQLYQFRLDAEGNASSIKPTSLMPAIEKHPILSEFARLPGKENGVDIEGITVRDGQLFVGFRGPVLRENHVPILSCRFANPVTHVNWFFISMGGLGVRDLVRVKNGFLVLAGPMGDGPGAYQLWHWDGRDCLPGKRAAGEIAGSVKLLGDVPMLGDEKAEGIALLNETDSKYEVLMVFDGLDNGGAARFRAAKR